MRDLKPTIEQVALEAGVSKRTALRVLSGATLGVRSDARERAEHVREAANRLHYQVSEIARSLGRGRTRTVGLLVGSITNAYFAGLAETVMDEAEKRGYRVIVELTRWNGARSVAALEHLQGLRVDGIFYASGYFKDEFTAIRRLRRGGLPLVMLAENELGIPAVARGYASALAEAVAELRSRGHRKVTFSIWNNRTLSEIALVRQFEAACASVGVRGVIHRPNAFDEMRVLAASRPPAVIGNAPYALKSFLDAAAGISDYAPDVVGVYDEWNWEIRPQGLVGAILLSCESQVRRATGLLIDQIEGRTVPKLGFVDGRFCSAAHFPIGVTADEVARGHLVTF